MMQKTISVPALRGLRTLYLVGLHDSLGVTSHAAAHGPLLSDLPQTLRPQHSPHLCVSHEVVHPSGLRADNANVDVRASKRLV